MVSQAAMRIQRVVQSEYRCWNPAAWLLVSLLGTLILVVISVLLQFGDSGEVKINKRAFYSNGMHGSTVTQYQVRLVNGKHMCEGRVEVLYNGQWGTVCDDGWDTTDGKVVCEQLGCGNVGVFSSFGQGKGFIHLDNVDCIGNEIGLGECRHSDWGIHNCGHNEDVGIICQDKLHIGARDIKIASPPSIVDGSIRLANGYHQCEGRVEIFYNGEWGTVCDDMWDITNANVVCKQLGCGTALSAHKQSYFKEGNGKIFLDNVECQGQELELSSCKNEGWEVHNCGHHEDAGVTCQGISTLGDPVSTEHQTSAHTTEATETMAFTVLPTTMMVTTAIQTTGPPLVRLMDGQHSCQGRVEIQYNNKWGTVCDDNWNLVNANVVCRQLGCGNATAATRGGIFKTGSGDILLDNVNCNGKETVLSDCQSLGWNIHNCKHYEDAGVICNEPETTSAPTTGLVAHTVDMTSPHPHEGMLRLVGGQNHCEGRVEVYLNSTWGTVCDDAWNLPDASVVCHQMGCGEAVGALENAVFGQGTGEILLASVKCTGTEAFLQQCSHISWSVHNCDHSEDAGVTCSLS